MAYLSPQHEAAFGQRRTAIDTLYKSGLARNEFERGQQRAQFGLNRSDMTRNLARLRQSLNPTFNRRGAGALRSGLFRRGLRDNATNALSQMSRLNLQEQGALGGLDIARQELEGQRFGNLAGLEADRLAQLAQLAMQMVGR